MAHSMAHSMANSMAATAAAFVYVESVTLSSCSSGPNTPTIDSLASEGIVLGNYYVQCRCDAQITVGWHGVPFRP